MLLDASRAAAPSDTAPVVLADAGVENVIAQVDELIDAGVLRRLLALTELQFSNSMIEAWVALPETSMALPPLARQRHDRPSTRGVLRRRTQPRASAFGVSRTDV